MGFESLSRLGFGGSGIPDTMPKAIAELQGLTFNLVAGAAANTAIPVPDILSEDTVSAVLNMTDLTEIAPSHVTITDLRASGTITLLTTLVSGDKVAVNGKTYTFTEMHVSTSTNVGPGIIPITVTPSGIDVDAVGDLFAKVLMSSDNGLTAANVDGVVTITWRTSGTVGNSKTLDVSLANGHATRSGATLSGGSATNSIKITDVTTAKKLLLVWYDKNNT